MKNLILIFAATLCIISTSVAQDNNDDLAFDGFHKSITIDLKRKDLIGGIKYDMRLSKGRMDGIGFKTGFATFSANRTESDLRQNTTVAALPFELNYVLGKKTHAFVTGIGVISTFAARPATRKINDVDLDVDGLEVIGGFLSLGYRYAPLKNGLTFQINYIPTWVKNDIYTARTQISIGYAFK